MHEDKEQFEQELREGLVRLADEAGTGPDAGEVMRRLRRRRIWHRTAVGTAAAAAIVIAAVFASYVRTADRGLMATHPNRSTDGKVVQASLAPLPVSAEPTQVEEAIQGYLASVGVHGGAVVTKDATGEVSFAFCGDITVSLEQVQADLAVLLRNYETASIQRRVDTLRYVLVASRSIRKSIPT